MFRRLVRAVLSPFTAFIKSAHDNADSRKSLRKQLDLASQLEERLKTDPENIALRQQLTECYHFAIVHAFSGPRSQRDQLTKKHAQHVLWFVQHAPEKPFAGSPYLFMRLSDSENAARVESAWRNQIELHPNNAWVLHNAALFLMTRDDEKAEELATKAHSLTPDNFKISTTLAQLLEMKMHDCGQEQKMRLANQCLELREQAMDETPAETKGDNLARAAEDAFEAGDNAKAQKYAIQLLQLAQNRYWDAGRALHKGNLILGRITLREGNVEQAKDRLLEAAKTPDTPFGLTTFGPNMTLAKELLEKGETEIVLDYFDKCEKFWHQKEMLDSWRKIVHEGGIPDFKGNLLY